MGMDRRKVPMDAEWGHGRSEAAANGDPLSRTTTPCGGIRYYTIRAASHKKNESLVCN